jgi:hypothetical protein
LYTYQASQHSLFCTASDRSTESTVLASLQCTQLTTFTYEYVSIFSRHFLSRSLFSLSQTQSTQSYGPVSFLIFCTISIFLLASLVAGRKPQCTAGADQQGMYSTIPIHWNIKSAPASPGRSRVGPAFYVFSFLGHRLLMITVRCCLYIATCTHSKPPPR